MSIHMPAKKEYSTPQLTTYGAVEKITQHKSGGKNRGWGDGMGGGRFKSCSDLKHDDFEDD